LLRFNDFLADPDQTRQFDITGLAFVGAEYQRKLLEFSQENAKAALDFAVSFSFARGEICKNGTGSK